MQSPPHSRRIRRLQQGFTLIELLVAMAIMAIMAAMGWRAVAGMQQANDIGRSHMEAVLTVEAGLNQWNTDLDALIELVQTRSLEWDGRALRLTRRTVQPGAGAVVVAWTRAERNGQAQWLRWQSPPVQTRQAWQAAWTAAAQWAQGTQSAALAAAAQDTAVSGLRPQEVAIVELAEWQLFFYRGGAWSNPLSSTDQQDASVIPEGIRLVLTLPPQHPLAGTVVRDWALGIRSGVQRGLTQ